MILASLLKATIDPNNVTAKVFESVTFVCSTTGIGDLSFVWEHDGSVIATSNSTSQQDFLNIDSIMPQHQGQYQCTVISSYSSLSSYAIATLNLNGNFVHIHTYIANHFVLIFFIPSTII